MRFLPISTLLIPMTAAVSLAWAEDTTHRISVMKTESCGCCNAWVSHLEEHGFEVETTNMSQGALNRFKDRSAIAPRYKSCHTGMVDGYVIEGHVPASDIMELLTQKPDALGLSVPRMPIGSPGMEMGDTRDAYNVLLMDNEGNAEVFSSYAAQ